MLILTRYPPAYSLLSFRLKDHWHFTCFEESIDGFHNNRLHRTAVSDKRALTRIFLYEFGERRTAFHRDFAQLVTEDIDGAVFDIGVSSMQLDEAERGFSFGKDAPLDMRMSQKGTSAADLVNTLKEEDLANLIYRYGEEKKSRAIARKIVEARKAKPIETTKELAEIIYTVIRRTPNAIDPATRTFQALRIAVNDELGELEKGLAGATSRLKPGGRLVVVDFHSLEDRIVKNFFKENAGQSAHVSRYLPEVNSTKGITFAKCSKAIAASQEEIAQNARSRSAKLRYAIKKQLEV